MVPGTITLDRLRDAIQSVMDWTGSHLHESIIGNTRYTPVPSSFSTDDAIAAFHRLFRRCENVSPSVRSLFLFIQLDSVPTATVPFDKQFAESVSFEFCIGLMSNTFHELT